MYISNYKNIPKYLHWKSHVDIQLKIDWGNSCHCKTLVSLCFSVGGGEGSGSSMIKIFDNQIN